jgi:hypothetical protein
MEAFVLTVQDFVSVKKDGVEATAKSASNNVTVEERVKTTRVNAFVKKDGVETTAKSA